MGVRFRKSIKAGPVRVNLSKSGVGYSVGGKGFRVAKKANGGVRTTASIPGTGISYVSDSGGGRKTAAGQSVEIAYKPINHTVELCLCLLLGWVGAHKFYRRKIGAGILYVLTLGLFGIGWVIDSVKCIYNYSKNKKAPGAENSEGHTKG